MEVAIFTAWLRDSIAQNEEPEKNSLFYSSKY